MGLAAGAWPCVALSARPLSVRGETVGNTLTAECLQLSCGDGCTLARSCEKQQRESPCTLAQPPPKEHLAKLQSSPTAGRGQRGAALLEPLTCLRLSPPALQEGCGRGVRAGDLGVRRPPRPRRAARVPAACSLQLGGARGVEVAPEAWRWRPRRGGGTRGVEVASEVWRWRLCPLHLLKGTSRLCFQLSAVTDEAVGSSGVQVSV